MGMSNPLLRTEIDELRLVHRGKVRDIYEVDRNLLIISTDRISAFDHVLLSGIPDKGRVLNQLSLFWFEKTREIVPNHLAAQDSRHFPEALARHRAILTGRSML